MTGSRSLIDRIAQSLNASASDSTLAPNLLVSTANLYGSRPESDDDDAPPTFDPSAAALFEAVVEAAFLVANADGVFDDTERRAFRQVVFTACGEVISERQIDAILSDLEAQLGEDGLDQRIHMVARVISTPEQAREVLRVAALIAHVSEGVSEVERRAMLQLAKECGLEPEALDEALAHVERALQD